MKDDERSLKPRIVQIGEKNGEILRHDHRLEDEGRRRKTRNIKVGIGGLESLLGAAPREEQLAIEAGLINAGHAAIDEDLLDVGQGLVRLGTAGLGVRRHGAPAGDAQRLALQLHHESAARRVGARRIAAQEHEARGKHRCKRNCHLARERAQKFLGLLQEEPAAIARLAVGCDGAAMCQALQRRHTGLDNPVTGHIVELSDQPKAAAIPFV